MKILLLSSYLLLLFYSCSPKYSNLPVRNVENISTTLDLRQFYSYIDNYISNDISCNFRDDTMTIHSWELLHNELRTMNSSLLLDHIRTAGEKVEAGDLRYKLFFDQLYPVLYNKDKDFIIDAILLYPKTAGLCKGIKLPIHLDTSNGYDWDATNTYFLLDHILDFDCFMRLDSLAASMIRENDELNYDMCLKKGLQNMKSSGTIQFKE